jgi:hypothetical protein
LKQLQFAVTNLLSTAFLEEVHCPAGKNSNNIAPLSITIKN